MIDRMITQIKELPDDLFVKEYLFLPSNCSDEMRIQANNLYKRGQIGSVIAP